MSCGVDFALPPVVLPLHVPFNWIVSVHVWTGLLGHLVIFRALWRRRAAARSGDLA